MLDHYKIIQSKIILLFNSYEILSTMRNRRVLYLIYIELFSSVATVLQLQKKDT